MRIHTEIKKRISKKDKLISKLPELLQGKTVKDIAREVGYTENSRKMYGRNIRSQIVSLLAITPEKIKRDFEDIKQRCLTG